MYKVNWYILVENVEEETAFSGQTGRKQKDVKLQNKVRRMPAGFS